jgi:adenosine deaminase
LRKSGYRHSDLLRGKRIPDDLLRELPKSDLLCHLDGALRISTFRELCEAAGVEVPATDRAALAQFFPVDADSCQRHFAGFFEHTVRVMQTEEALRRVAYEVAEDAAAQGCLYLEVRFCPLNHQAGGLSLDESVAAVRKGLDQAEKAFGLHSGIIITGIRTIGPELSLKLAELAVRWKGRGVVAFDLAGEEEDYPAKLHIDAFYLIMNNNMHATIHAGEGFGAESIHQALHYCGANRIGHGLRLHEDEDLLQYVNDLRIPLEMSLSSNVVTGVVPTLAAHPLRRYMDLGLRVTLNTDNPLFARTNLTLELRKAVDTFDLTLIETEFLLLNGFKSAFMPQKVKSQMIGDVLDTFNVLREKHGLDDLEIA